MNMSLQWVLAGCLLWVASASGQEVSCRIDLLILIDRSGSIKDAPGGITNWLNMMTFVQNIINMFATDQLDSHVALVTFGNRERIYNNLTPDRTVLDDTMNQLRAIEPNDNTNTSSGLYTALTQIFTGTGDSTGGDRPGVHNVIILITDGVPTRGLGDKTGSNNPLIKQEVLDLATQLKNDGTLLITIGVTNAIDIGLLTSVASTPDNFINVTNFDALEAELTPLIQSTCVIIEAKTTPPPPKECRQNADIYFVLDSSGSIREQRFKAVREYVTKIMKLLPIGQGVRVGVLYYSQTDFQGFNLLQYNTIDSAVTATLEIPYLRETTNTMATIRYLRQTGFSANEGDRPGVPNIAVFFTDGNSNIDSRDTLNEAYEAKKQGIHFISMGIGTWINAFELQSIASDPWTVNYIQVDNYRDFMDSDPLVGQVKALLCNDVNECDNIRCQCGGTCTDKIGDYMCSCPNTCAGKMCERDCSQRGDVVFAVDSSSSLQAKDFRQELDFVRNAVIGLNIAGGDQVGLLRFSTDTFVRFDLNDYSNANGILNAITLYFNGGVTNTNLALQTARTNLFTSGNGDKQSNANVLVILTDGRSTNFSLTWKESVLVRQAGINIISVGIGNSIRMKELEAMASGIGSNNVFTVSDFTSLTTISNDVVDAVCNNRGECESMNCQNGGVPVDHMGYCTCRCPTASSSSPGYSGQYCERQCSGKIDIVLIIDASGSIRKERMTDVLEFVTDFVSAYPVGDNYARFGAIYFSDAATKAFDLNTYSLQEDIITHIKEIPFMGGRTNIADALKIAETLMFTSSNGDRSDAPNFVFVLTDGNSNIKAEQTIPNAIAVKENVAKIVVLGIGNDANTLELRGMSSYPTSSMMMMAPSFRDIKTNSAMRTQLMNTMIMGPCDDVNECDANPCVRGTCIDDYHNYICNCPFQWGGRNCDRECPVQLDVALVLDFSSSLDIVYNTVIGFAREMVYGLPVPNNVRIAVVDYDDTARVHFNLNKYTSDKEFILNALSFGQKGTRTNTQAALTLLTNEIFTSQNGDRNGVKNVAVVVTDGGSNINQPNTANAAAQARSAGIEIFVAAFGNYQMAEVNEIASDPDSTHTVQIGLNNDVSAAAKQMLDRLCQL